ncbi:hypothetical protein U1Q18_023624, partial [Sarracenia purpurea var. burkii]
EGFCSAYLTVRIPRSGHLDRRSVLGGGRRPGWDCRPGLRNALRSRPMELGGVTTLTVSPSFAERWEARPESAPMVVVNGVSGGDRRLAVRSDVMATPPSSRKSRGLIIPCASHLLCLQLRYWPPSLFLSPRDGAGDIGFWPLVFRYLVSDPPTSMSLLPLGSFAISDPGKVDLCFKPEFVLSHSFLGLLDLLKNFSILVLHSGHAGHRIRHWRRYTKPSDLAYPGPVEH